jgi:hypothetical protein
VSARRVHRPAGHRSRPAAGRQGARPGEQLPLYDVQAALLEMDAHLVAPDPLTIETAALGQRLALQLARHIPPGADQRCLGEVLLVAAASLSSVATSPLPPQVLVNILAFAGRHIVRNGVRHPLDAGPADSGPGDANPEGPVR